MLKMNEREKGNSDNIKTQQNNKRFHLLVTINLLSEVVISGAGNEKASNIRLLQGEENLNNKIQNKAKYNNFKYY